MSWDVAQKLADAVLYEGYLLYPYRASALKNQFRWQFGIVAPRSDTVSDEPGVMQTELLFEPGARPALDLKIRFLQLQTRVVEQLVRDEEWEPVERLELEGREWLTWDEAVPQEFVVRDIALAHPIASQTFAFEFGGAREIESIRNAAGSTVARLVRTRVPLSGVVILSVARAGAFWKLAARVENSTAFPRARNASRTELLRYSMISTHTLLALRDAQFLSAIDPPEEAQAHAADCHNLHTYPVLVGKPPAREMVLSAPIILYDYPAIAPESTGDLFDATEIDEMLTLRLMTLSETEQREAKVTDERSRELIERAHTLPPEMLERLHGAVRQYGSVTNAMPEKSAWESLLNPPRSRAAHSVEIDGHHVCKGTRVRLHPRKGADAMDMFLAGQAATVAGVFVDLEDQPHIAVTVDRDGAADLRDAYGRYFYFRPDEIEVVHSAHDANPMADQRRVLIAGIGNIFLGDDGFGPAVIERLTAQSLPSFVHAKDFGVRGVHLAYDLLDATYETTIIVDAMARGGVPGTIYVVEPEAEMSFTVNPDAHSMHVEAVLALVKRMGGTAEGVFIVGCEPESVDPAMGLSDCVAKSIPAAVDAVLNLLAVAAR